MRYKFIFFSWYFSPLFSLSSKNFINLAQERLIMGLFSSWVGFQKLIREIMFVRGPLREAWGEAKEGISPRRKRQQPSLREDAGPEITGSHVGQGTWFQLLQRWENPRGPGLMKPQSHRPASTRGWGQYRRAVTSGNNLSFSLSLKVLLPTRWGRLSFPGRKQKALYTWACEPDPCFHSGSPSCFRSPPTRGDLRGCALILP